MTAVRVFLFGKLKIQVDGQEVSNFDARKVQELFCYLLLNRGRVHARETLATLLWEDKPAAQSRKYLRHALWQLQALFADRSVDGAQQMLRVEDDWVSLNAEAPLWLDVALFEQANVLCRGVPGTNLAAQQMEALRCAVDLYQGDLLEGWYCDWCLFERERLQNMYLDMLDKMLDCCAAHGEYEAGLDYGERVLRLDRARERTHRRMMRLHYLAGDRTGALRQYERCAAALAQELKVKPSKLTLALCEEIRADYGQARLHAGRPMATTPARGGEAGDLALDEFLERLRSLHLVVGTLQKQLERDIQLVEQALAERR